MAKTGKKAKVEINDGSMIGLAKGAKMNPNSSIIELTDNASDAGANKISIIVKNERVCVLSVEKTNLKEDDYRTLFNLGAGKKTKIHENGVGKFSQGFNYATASLIGDGRKGTVTVAVNPINGKKWGAIQTIDYTNEENYTDSELYFTDGSELIDGFDFMVDIHGCEPISDYEIVKLRAKLSIRYRQKINEGMTILLNGGEILAEDRLYSHLGNLVDYHEPIALPYCGNENAARWEWVDARCYGKKTNAEINDLILNDNIKVGGREIGAVCTARNGIEVVVNGVSVIECGQIKNITGINPQPSSSGFRGRLTINDIRLADKYVIGGNKSDCEIASSFNSDIETMAIREAIGEAYRDVVSRYKDEDIRKLKVTLPDLQKFLEKEKFNVDIQCYNNTTDTEAFCGVESDNEIRINLKNSFFDGFSKAQSKSLFIISLLYGAKDRSFDGVLAHLNEFKAMCTFYKIM